MLLAIQLIILNILYASGVLQKKYPDWKPYVWERVTQSTEPVNHDDEEDWGIAIESDEDEDTATTAAAPTTATTTTSTGLKHSFEAAPSIPNAQQEDHTTVHDVPEDSMEDLMAQLEAI